MMIIDVRKLNAERKYEGELHFTLQADQNLVTLPLTEIASEIAADGNYVIFDDDSVEVKGTVRYLLRGSCSRCLKPVEKRVEAEWNACFVKGESDGETYSYEKGVIQPDESVRDTVMLSMPQVLLCEDGCKGIAYDNQNELNDER